ncbi:hypothetical protein [Metabacillus rhizolycopersici]|uniref:Uncharacterized protein n=1 Tax=Metabacillus rhizolycopersici TaxID=2875709 RepID=A0ABS7UT65_9BACI|nr:hypothetical protein [Metabacillus rhizolycopersici]MBZ5751272.1 hypothetical protein [Metabacillus rhizolycopersici]
MSLKSQLKHLERNIKPKEKGSVQEWRERFKRNEEMESVVDRTFSYRDVYIKVAAMNEGYEPRYEDETGLDVWYHNLKATYKYLEEKGKVPNTREPVLKNWNLEAYSNKYSKKVRYL